MMARDFGKCETTVTDPIILLKEKRSAIRFLNPKRKKARKVVVDGCAITEGIRCDYLLIDPSSHEHFVELKGCDVGHGVDQLCASIKQLSVDPHKHPKSSYVICTQMPLSDPELQIAVLKFRKDFNSGLVVRRPQHEVAL